MADPSPVLALPEFEYIELYNHGSTQVNLLNWILIIGSHQVILEEAFLDPAARIILCDAAAAVQFPLSVMIMTVNLPAILNTGQQLILKTSDGMVMHAIHFTDKWYKNPSKAQGGWSLEMIDPENPCGGINNWKASEDPKGGTPGMINSVYSLNPDEKSPYMVRATLPDDTTVTLHFSEPMQSQSLSETSDYSANNGLLHPLVTKGIPPDYSCVNLFYNKPFQTHQIYTLSILPEMEDCAGNRLEGNLTARFCLPVSADSGDIIINEVLFHAGSNDEFIELYNRSENVIDLKNLILCLADPVSREIKKTMEFKEKPFQLFPDQYLAISGNIESLIRTGMTDNRCNLLEYSPFFSLPDQQGMIVLKDTSGTLIDEMIYNDSMLGNFLKDHDGVSLERIGTDISALSRWEPSVPSYGFCTPGLQNSQIENLSPEWNLTISSDYISPDGDGVDDYITLELKLTDAGWMGTFSIYDLNGTSIKTFMQNSLMGTKELFVWYGETNSGKLASIGLYVFFGDMIHPDGRIKKIRKVIPLIMK